jgi:hypothetical protein
MSRILVDLSKSPLSGNIYSFSHAGLSATRRSIVNQSNAFSIGALAKVLKANIKGQTEFY